MSLKITIQPGGSERCPMCRESISRQAKICPHCRTDWTSHPD